jgi:hypothetical protein
VVAVAETERRTRVSEYQEEVLTNLLGLQAELRGDEPKPHDAVERPTEQEDTPGVSAGSGPSDPGETIAVSEGGLTVSVDAAPIDGQIDGQVDGQVDGWGVNDRIAALNERLDRLEYHLAGVTKRIERMEPERVMEMDPEADSLDVDARWRSFLDLQKIVADRLDHRR